MRRAVFIILWIAAGTAAVPVSARPYQQAQPVRVVDRIVARIEDDIILQSQVRQLAAFQQLVDGHAESDNQLVQELIEQWVVETEATASHFPQPAESEIDRELARLSAQFPNPGAYGSKLGELGLSTADVRQLLARQIYLERYVDYKFRPSVQIEPKDIEAYYRTELLPELAKTNQTAPRLEDVEDQIREVLTQRAISGLAAKWLDDTKSHLNIEQSLTGSAP